MASDSPDIAGDGPAWTPCPACEDAWCEIHQMHAFECPCPSVEEWDVDPYCHGYRKRPSDLTPP